MAKTFKKEPITPERVMKFLEGYDPQERIVNFEYQYKDDFIKVFYRDENDNKKISREPFYPFLWATKDACLKLCNRDRNELLRLFSLYNIRSKALDTTDMNGNVSKSLEKGYTYMFYAIKPMSYSKFLEFFKVAGNPVYRDNKKKSGKESFTNQPTAIKDSKQYLTVTPIEQYMISTGKRMFKGYEDYDECLRMIIDLETTGLLVDKDRIEQIGIRFNRPVKYRGEYITYEKVFDTVGDTEFDRNMSELENIVNLLKVIKIFQPDIITAHNGEAFDFNMIEGACKRLGTTIEALSGNFFNGQYMTKSKRESVLKLGGEVETYRQTIIPGSIVTDSLHAVRRAQALDSNMLFSNLKYVTKYSKIVKTDRVYVPGNRISEIWNDNEERYAFNKETGDWYIYDPDYKMQVITPDPLKDIDYFRSAIEGDKYIKSVSGSTYGKYEDGVTAEELYNSYIESIRTENETNRLKKGKDGDKFTLYTKNFIIDGYELTSGRNIVYRYLLDDLWECDKVEHRYNIPNFLICKMLPVPFLKCCTMGTAGQWKSMMLAWSYENDLAIPPFAEKKKFTGGLARLLKVGYVPKVGKFDYNSLYPGIMLTWGISDEKDLMQTILAFLNHVLTQREKYKGLKKKASKQVESIKAKIKANTSLDEKDWKFLNDELAKWEQEESANDKKQLPLKIFGNSLFGSFGAPYVFPWASIDCAERTTCIGRMCLRLMIYWFKQLYYEPIVGDTDGFNFQLPDNKYYRYTEEHPYISTGLSRETEKGKAYVGFKGDVAEFNDLFMRDMMYAPNGINKMGLGIDEIVTATINFARKNYADWFEGEAFPNDVKMVGNTIKSKKMPEYIAKFLEKGVRLLLEQKGQEFIDYYYEYVDKIYNYRIPLKQIASKGKIKKSLTEYILDCTKVNSAGRSKPRQAWMELAMKHNLDVHMGEVIYFINTGTAKSHTDLKTVTSYYEKNATGEPKDMKVTLEKEWKKDTIDGKAADKDNKLSFNAYVKKHHPEIEIKPSVILNCKLLPQEMIDSETDVFCKEGEEYNVPKYIEMFNKRITPLLVCFHPDIRNRILVNNPDDRQYFTAEECELCCGFPNQEKDQDTYEQLMTLEDKEIKFWIEHPQWKVPFIEECGMNWDEIVKDYNERKEREKRLGIEAIREAYEDALNHLSNEELDNFEEGDFPPSLSNIIDIDPKTGSFVCKDYPDIVIGTIYDIFEIKESRYENNFEDDSTIIER